MLRVLRERLRQRKRTISFPKSFPQLPSTYIGLPSINQSKCEENCELCISQCPTDAIYKKENKLHIDLGRCIFCGDCAKDFDCKAINFSTDYKIASKNRGDLYISKSLENLSVALDEKSRKIFGRSLKLRQVSAAGCNACEADINVLNTVVFDLARFGIQFVASPRHADGIVITGPVSENMSDALTKTWESIPSPKIAIAVGACAISGGIFAHNEQVYKGADSLIPIDLYIPGCPPHPLTILSGILRCLNKM